MSWRLGVDELRPALAGVVLNGQFRGEGVTQWTVRAGRFRGGVIRVGSCPTRCFCGRQLQRQAAGSGRERIVCVARHGVVAYRYGASRFLFPRWAESLVRHIY